MSVRFLKIAALYLVAGMSLGAYMGATENFTLAPVHAHVNLLGFMIPTLVGLIGLVRPVVLETRLATVFFWLYQITVPVSMLALAWMLTGHRSIAPVVGIFSAGMWLAGVLYAINLWMTLSPSPRSAK
ncbi:cytochrome-c oxidase [Pseudolysobacter antarcticus]|uniref:Cytochrome-c oxidase n=1 Tax=Pseudolysobacter antarcticus TaxID=2511995 RepID=A0A411HII5_9GAMM|nr:cytochrome-c oxidase [Pseudolysobacter antarcticus]QBB70315.1 cytochrome-c oxidase [Pseudolysobacter antarcticus]